MTKSLDKKLISIAKNHARELTLAAVCLLVYVPTFIWMWGRWFARDSYYTHGILIPLVSIFLIWQKRETLAKIHKASSPWGIKLIFAGLAIHLFSSLFRVYFSSGFSLMLVIPGLILHLYGTAMLMEVAFPVAFLFFMIPLPMVIIANISFQMKLFAAQIAAAALNGMHIPAVREGSLIKMRTSYVIVDDVCSGLRSLISLTALGSIFAYWMTSSRTKKIILFLSTIPIAILTNVVRIIFLSIVSEVWGPQHTEGFIHDFSGFMVFALAFLMLFAVGKILE
ncbi:MAG TPA: exosortase/archaeosortase family protein [Candidatus Omnitrophota bacterium]|nr:exosortase/archaeosortase family protein [Candidatus Omnitrophota bacterium]HPD85192.1 exosortase/archaeosortase family protein [Candidatus Omnitrophota bacterium]HRZ04307.1 exosortase/archaeosortase family protein [Candidatus Omnitrophota bacterium]